MRRRNLSLLCAVLKGTLNILVLIAFCLKTFTNLNSGYSKRANAPEMSTLHGRVLTCLWFSSVCSKLCVRDFKRDTVSSSFSPFHHFHVIRVSACEHMSINNSWPVELTLSIFILWPCKNPVCFKKPTFCTKIHFKTFTY